MRRLHFPPSPAHPGSVGLGWDLAGTHSRLHQASCPCCCAGPGGMQPSLSRLPSLCFWLQFIVCLVFPFFLLLFASIIPLLAFPSSFLLHACPHPIPGISICPPQPFLSSHSHHPLPLPSVRSAIPLLPSVFPAAIRANQIPEQLCKAISGFPLIPGGGERSWTIRLFHAGPSLINTINNTGQWPHLCHWWDYAGHGPATIPGHAGCPTAGPGTWDAPREHAQPPSSCPCSCPRSGPPCFRSLGECFGGGHSLCCGADARCLLQRISLLAPQPGAPLLLLDL